MDVFASFSHSVHSPPKMGLGQRWGEIQSSFIISQTNDITIHLSPIEFQSDKQQCPKNWFALKLFCVKWNSIINHTKRKLLSCRYCLCIIICVKLDIWNFHRFSINLTYFKLYENFSIPYGQHLIFIMWCSNSIIASDIYISTAQVMEWFACSPRVR